MYKIEKKEWGFWLTFSGKLSLDEINDWYKESQNLLVSEKNKFSVLIDMRTLEPLSEDIQLIIKDGQRLYRLKGMIRSAVILSNQFLTMQFKRIAIETWIYNQERYINADKNPAWEKQAIDWILSGIEPDKKNPDQ
jgi:hypothetical protein